MMIPVNVLGVHVERLSGAPIVLLSEKNDGRVLPIFVGPAEAQAIVVGLQGIERPRPGTYELMLQVLEAMDAEVAGVEVTELREATFIADLVLSAAGVEKRVSARPSDAIALAVRTGVPVTVNHEVLDDAGVEVTYETDDALGEERIDEIVDEFRSQLASASPRDFIPADDADDDDADDDDADDDADPDDHSEGDSDDT